MISPEGISDWLCCRTARRYPNRLSDGGATLCLESEIGARPPPASGVTFLFFLFLSHPLIENPSIGFSALYRSRHRLFFHTKPTQNWVAPTSARRGIFPDWRAHLGKPRCISAMPVALA